MPQKIRHDNQPSYVEYLHLGSFEHPTRNAQVYHSGLKISYDVSVENYHTPHDFVEN